MRKPLAIKLKLPIDSTFIRKYNLGKLAAILAATGLFLFALNLTGYAFKIAGGDFARYIFSATYNPFISLFIGLVVTAIIQSSSTTTSIIVAAVAAGSLDFSNAIPMIMGANIGTTLTSTMVSLGYITKRKEFRKAIAAGTQHDFFNILVTALLFPLELYYGLLSRLSLWVTSYIAPFEPASAQESYSYGFGQDSIFFNWAFATPIHSLIVLLIAFVVLIVSIKLLSRLLYNALIGNLKHNLQRLIFATPLRAFLWGTALTATVQSSSVTTPLAVPLVATGKISLKQSFPYILGANLGTTITALIAALYHSPEAISIAIAHVLFNFIGILIFFPFNSLRKIPLKLANRLGRLTLHYRMAGFAYIILTFFLVPFVLIYFNQDFVNTPKKEANPTHKSFPLEQNPYPNNQQVLTDPAQKEGLPIS